MPLYTVSQVARYLKDSLEKDPFLADLWIMGEISNLSTSPAGHTFLTLKDAQSQLRCVMFSGGEGAELLVNGNAVCAHGRISFYEARGSVDLIADLVMPEGTGPLALEFERLKMRLEAEGLFQESRKRPLPTFPNVIGVVTSPTGAVLHDIERVLARRYPLVELVLAPTQVQGEQAAAGIVAAIKALNDDKRSDVIILARGGGSLEELWPFNEEVVARAIYASAIPVVSAVGHERDYTIADYVADLRAPTPSAAAELVVPDYASLAMQVRDFQHRAALALSYQLAQWRSGLTTLARRAQNLAPDIVSMRRHVDDLTRTAATTLNNTLSIYRERAKGLELRLHSLNPSATLHRGYSIVEKVPQGEVVSRVSQAAVGDSLKVTVGDGAFPAVAGGTARPRKRKPHPVYAGERLL